MPRKRKPRLIRSARAIMSSRQEARDSRDFFPTPPFGTRALLEVVLPTCGFTSNQPPSIGRIWEPAAGEGHIADVLAQDYGLTVRASDIHDYGRGEQKLDFLKVIATSEPDWIITNPPFSGTTDRALAFTLRALDLARVGVAMFVRSQWINEGGERYEKLFRPHPPTLIAFFSERVPLCKGRWDPKGSTATAYCWVIWIKGREPMPPFWIPPEQRQRLSRPDDVKRFAAWSLPQEEAAE